MQWLDAVKAFFSNMDVSAWPSTIYTQAIGLSKMLVSKGLIAPLNSAWVMLSRVQSVNGIRAFLNAPVPDAWKTRAVFGVSIAGVSALATARLAMLRDSAAARVTEWRYPGGEAYANVSSAGAWSFRATEASESAFGKGVSGAQGYRMYNDMRTRLTDFMNNMAVAAGAGLQAAAILAMAELTAKSVVAITGTSGSLAAAMRVAAQLVAIGLIVIVATSPELADADNFRWIMAAYVTVTFVFMMRNIGDYDKIGSAFVDMVKSTARAIKSLVTSSGEPPASPPPIVITPSIVARSREAAASLRRAGARKSRKSRKSRKNRRSRPRARSQARSKSRSRGRRRRKTRGGDVENWFE